MNLKDTTEAELIALLEKTPTEQENYLACNKIQKSTNCFSVCCPDCDYSWDEDVYESLPDLAERLWDKAQYECQKQYIAFTNSMVDVFALVTCLIKPEEGTSKAEFWCWWACEAKPIHRIIAALIALKRSGIEC